MRQLVGSNYGSYSFNPSNRTITIAGISDTLKISNFLAITNLADGVIIYIPNNAAKGAASVIDNIITLNYDTTAMSSSDELQILVDVPSKDTELLKTLLQIKRLLEPLAHVDPANFAQKVSVMNTPAVTVSSGTITTVTAVTGVTNRISANVDQLNGIDPRFLLQDQTREAFNTGIRSKMTFS